MPYASPQSSPSASTPTSPRHASFFSDDSHSKQASTSPSPSHRPHHQRTPSILASPWSAPAPGPMPTLPRRSSSSNTRNASSSTGSSMIGSPSGGMVLPRRMSREKSPGFETKPKTTTDSLGLSQATSASTKDLSSDSPSPSPSPSPPPGTSSRPSSTSLGPAVVRRVPSNISLRRTGSPSLRVDIPPPNTIQASSSPLAPIPRTTRSQPSTPSVHHLGPPRPTSSMIRKKSGEVVRPALKHRISRSTPVSGELQDEFMLSASSGRRTSVDEANESEDRWEKSRSEPATPFNALSDDDEEEEMHYGPQSAGERKTLRFAGEEGEDGELERVVLFKSKHKVSAVSRVLEGEDVDRVGTDTETETEGPGVRRLPSRSVWASPGYGSSTSSPLADNERVLVHQSESSPIPRIHGLNFGDQAGKKILVPEWDNVVLESMKIAEDASGGGTLVLKGTIAVRNITFGKWVAVRFTWDDWQTTSEVTASHQFHIPASVLNSSASANSSAYIAQGWDRFAFSIKLDDVRRKIDERKLLLVVRYSIDGGQEWWDNNMGGNYRIVFKRVTKPTAPPSTASQTKASTGSKPAPLKRSVSSGGNAFLPLLEGSRPKAQPLPAPSSTASTHRPLPARFPSQSTQSVSEWSFPRATPAAPPIDIQSALPTPPPSHDHTPITAPMTLDHSPSPPQLQTTAPTSPPCSPDRITFRADVAPANTRSSNILSPTPSPARPTHARTSTWNAPSHSGSGLPLKNRSHQSSLSSFSGLSSLPPLPASPLPASKFGPALSSSDSRSPPSPSTSPLPATPISLPNELGSPGIRALPEIGPGSSRVLSPMGKDTPLDSNSYADFVAKYCFFQPPPQSSTSSSPGSTPLPTSVSSSLASSPATTSPLTRSGFLPTVSTASVYAPRPSPRNAASSPWSEDATTPTARSPNPTAQATRSYFAIRGT